MCCHATASGPSVAARSLPQQIVHRGIVCQPCGRRKTHCCLMCCAGANADEHASCFFNPQICCVPALPLPAAADTAGPLWLPLRMQTPGGIT